MELVDQHLDIMLIFFDASFFFQNIKEVFVLLHTSFFRVFIFFYFKKFAGNFPLARDTIKFKMLSKTRIQFVG